MEEEEWENISNEAKDLVQKLLMFDVKKRISAKDALNHPWIVQQTKHQLNEKLTRNTLINPKSFNVSIILNVTSV